MNTFLKLQPFDLDLALSGSPVVTRDGRSVTDIRIINESAPKSAKEANDNDLEYEKRIEVTIHNPDFSGRYSYYHNGGYHKYGLETEADLFLSKMVN